MAEYVDTISRQAAIDALWKALYDYEDETEKQFQESDELDASDWILHRIFVQNMSDIDRQTILALPSAQPEIIRCKDCKYYVIRTLFGRSLGWCERLCDEFDRSLARATELDDYCSRAEPKGEQE